MIDLKRKTSKKLNITLFTALLVKIGGFVSARAAFLTNRPLRHLLPAQRYTLALVSIILIPALLHTLSVSGQTKDPDEFTVEVINVFPTNIQTEGWQNVETLYMQDLGPFELYQSFNENNSAYIDITEVHTVGESDVQDDSDTETQPTSGGGTQDNESTTDNTDSTGNTTTETESQLETQNSTSGDSQPEPEVESATSEGESLESEESDEPVESEASVVPENEKDNAADAEEVVTPDADEGTGDDAETASEPEQEPEPEPAAEPEPEVAPKEPPADEVSYGGFKRASGAFALAFRSVYERLPFVNEEVSGDVSETTDAPEPEVTEESVVEPEPEVSTEEDVLPQDVEENIEEETLEDDGVGSEVDEEIAPEGAAIEVDSPETSPATATTNTVDQPESEADVDDATTTQTQGNTNENVEENGNVDEEPQTPQETQTPLTSPEVGAPTCEGRCKTRTITMSGFGLPIFDENTVLDGGQVRFSLAARSGAGSELPQHFAVRYSLDAGATWNTGMDIDIDDENSNSINGGYFLAALPSTMEADQLNQLMIEFVYTGDAAGLEGLYIDSAWVELFTLKQLSVDEVLLFELNADDGFETDMLTGDELALPDGEVVEFMNTDENEDETLIIKSDKYLYEGLTKTTVYFNVTNTSDEEDAFSLKTYFPEDEGSVTLLEEWNQNKPYTQVVPEYRPYVYHCQAGWETLSSPTGTPLEDISKQLSPQQESTEDQNGENVEADEDTESVQSTVTETVTEVETPADEGADPVEDAAVNQVEVEDEFEDVDAAEPLLALTATGSATNTETSVDETASSTEAGSEDDALTQYICRDTSIVRECDSIEGDNTACRIENVKVQDHVLKRYRGGWEQGEVAEGSIEKERNLFQKTKDFLGFGLETKEIPETFEPRAYSKDEYHIRPGETRYFKMQVEFEPFTKGEFWIEAIGNDDLYGLLDPFWSSEWTYRMPVTLDNTSGTDDLTEHQVFLELAGASTTFWDNVNSDGSDIRFVAETTNVSSEDWFGTDRVSSDWLDFDWNSRTRITIAAAEVHENLTDFPVFVDLSHLGDDFFSNVDSAGDDIRVTKADGTTELPFEIVDIDTGTETGELHFKADSLSSSVDTSFYIYYENSGASPYGASHTYGSENVWTNGYEAVYHFSDTPTGSAGDITNSTGGSNGTSANLDGGDVVTGRMGDGYDFGNATNDQIVFADLVGGNTAVTVSYWVENPAFDDGRAFSSGDNADNMLAWPDNDAGGAFDCAINGTGNRAAGTTTVASGWGQHVCTWDGSTIYSYVNGNEDGFDTLSGGSINTDTENRFGQDDSGESLTDVADELRILNTAVSQQWVRTEYTNQSNPTAFYATSSREQAGLPTVTGNWQRRIPITIQASEVTSDLADFPVYVDLSTLGNEFFNLVRSDGGDIRITEGDGLTELSYELVSISTANQTGELYFKANNVSSSVDTTFYIYYNNPNESGYAATETYGAQNVWTNNYEAVLHFEEDPGGSAPQYTDSTGNGHNATVDQMNSGNLFATPFGNGFDANGTDESVIVPGFTSLGTANQPYAIGIWFNADLGETDGNIVGMSLNNPPAAWRIPPILMDSDNVDGFSWPGSSRAPGSTAITQGDWYQAYTTWSSGDGLDIYLNGANDGNVAQATFSASGGSNFLHLAGDVAGGAGDEGHFNGKLDELRVFSDTLGADWISAEHSNMDTPSTFYATGTPQHFTTTTYTELNYWLQFWDYTGEDADVWVQVDSIPASASTTIYLYYGNSTAESTSDEHATFSYSTPQALYYTVTPNGSSLDVYSLVDDNVVSIDGIGTTTLDMGETTSFTTFTGTSVIRATGPLSPKIDSDDAMVPISFATTTFAAPSSRGNETFHLFAPFATADYDIVDGVSIEASGSIPAGTQVSESGSNIGASGIVETNEPVLVYEERGNDYHVLYPATTRDLYGIHSNDNYIGSTQNNTDFDIACSGGSTVSVTGQNRGVQYTNATCASGAEGAGDAVRVHGISEPVGAIQQADSDGNETTSFLPTMEFGTEYYFPSDAAYVAIACAPKGGAVNIAVYSSGDTVIESGTCSPSGSNPGKLYFDGGNGGDTTAYTAGYRVASTDSPRKPFYAYYEDSEIPGGGDENNVWGSVQARKFSPASLVTTFGEQEVNNDAQYEQRSHRWYENTNAETPTDAWPLDDEGTRVLEGQAITGQGAINAGDILRLRMNLEANVATGTVESLTSFKLQYAEAESAMCSAATESEWFDIGEIGSSTAAFSGYNNAGVGDGLELSSTTLAASTVFGTYEEENETSILPNAILPDEVAEWDWVIESTNPEVNTSYCFRMVRSSGVPLVTYTSYPELITAGPPQAPTLSVYFDNEKTTDLNPVFEFVANDLGGDDLHYYIEVDDDWDFTSPTLQRNSVSHFNQFENINDGSDKSPFNNAAPVRFTSAVSLTPTTTYWWRVRAADPTGSNTFGEWSTPYSFTTDGDVVVSTWFQTTGKQFGTNSLTSLATSSGAVSVSGGAGTMVGSAVDFDDATVGNSWGTASWNDTQTSGTITYQIEYNTGSTWTLIPDADLPNNSVGTTTGPFNLNGLDTDTYDQIRLVATFSGATLSIEDWTVSWGLRVNDATLEEPFNHEKIATTTPTLEFFTTDPQNDRLQYEVSWSSDAAFTTSSTTVNSSSTPGFLNVTTPADTSPFVSGDTINYTLTPGQALTEGETYWWRVRAKDPSGGDAFAPWSDPHAFTIDTGVTVSTWFQTTAEQFEDGTLDGSQASTTGGYVTVSDDIGEYGTVVVTNGVAEVVNTTLEYNNPIVVTSVRYPRSGADGTQRVSRVTEKTSDSFTVLADNYDGTVTGTTTVDYMVIEEGGWTLPDGDTGTRVVAGSVNVSTVSGRSVPVDPGGTAVSFSPPFGSAPAVIANVASNNDPNWIFASVYNGSNTALPPDENGFTTFLNLNWVTPISHGAEDVDYIAMEVGDGTNNGGAFRSVVSPDSVGASPQSVTISPAFASAPEVTVVMQATQDGGDGGYILVDTDNPATTNSVTLAVDEDGPGNTRTGHVNEVASIFAFEDASGILKREGGGGLSGTVASPPIDFSDGLGPKFEQYSFYATSTGGSTTTVQVQYLTSTGSWALIPDSAIPGNSDGTTTSPVNLTAVDVSTYDTIRLFGNLECSPTTCPTLNDWTVEWSEGVSMSGTIKEYDRLTDVTSGTIRVAVNDTLLGSTGSVSGGTWTVNNVTAFAGDVVTVFVDGAPDENEAVAVFVYDGVGDITGVELFERHLSLSADENATTTNALLSSYDNSVSGDEDIFFDVEVSNTLDVCDAALSGCEDANLYIGSGNVYIPDTAGSGNVTTHDFINDGTLELDANTMRVSGSWDNNNTFSSDTSTVIFTATSSEPDTSSWYNLSWDYRVPVTIQSSQVDDDLTNFPVYVDLSTLDAEFFSNLNSDGGDIRVTESNGVTEVAREVVSASTTLMTGELHFNAPTLSSTTNTTFYIYYGNATATDYDIASTSGAENVWNSGFEAVYHLSEAGSTYLDSTTNDNDGAGEGTDPSLTTGIIGGGQSITAGRIDIGNGMSAGINSAGEYILSAWVNHNTSAGDQAIVAQYDGTGDILFWGDTDGAGDGYCHYNGTYMPSDCADTNVQTPGTWQHVVARYDGTSGYVYVDGVAIGNGAQAAGFAVDLSKPWSIGSEDGDSAARQFNGLMDEVRIHSTDVGEDWIQAEFRNIDTPTTFYATSSIETRQEVTDAFETLDDSSGTLTFYNVTFGEGSGDAEWFIQDTFDANRDLFTTYGTFNRDDYAVRVGRHLNNGANGLWAGSGVTTFDGATSAQWTDSAATKQNIGDAIIDGNVKTVTLQSSVEANTITIGANDRLDAGGANTITVYGNFTNNNTFTPRTSTVDVATSSATVVLTIGASSFYNLTFSGAGTQSSFASPNATVLNDITIATGTVTFPSTRLSVAGSFDSAGGIFQHNNAEVRFTGSGVETITASTTMFLNTFYDLLFTGSGDWTFLDTNSTTSHNFTVTNGDVTLPGGTLTVVGNFDVSGSGAFTHNDGEVIFLIVDSDTIEANGSAFNDTHFRGGGTSGVWLSLDWNSRRSITIDADDVTADMTDFPVYVDLSDLGSQFFENVNSDGGDIRVTEEDGITEVAREVVGVATSTEEGELYFLAGSLSTTTDTTFYIYYGNSSESDYLASDPLGSESVWVNGFEGVFHLEEDPSGSAPQMLDSTGNGHDGTAFNIASGDSVLGAFGQSLDHNGGSDRVRGPGFSNLGTVNQAYSISTWFNPDTGVTDGNLMQVSQNADGTGWCLPMLAINGDNIQGISWIGSQVTALGGTGVTQDAWNQGYTTWDSTNGLDVYLNGAHEDNAAQATFSASGASNYIHTGFSPGSCAGNEGPFDGQIDEVRIYDERKDADWIATEYNNLSSTTDFYIVGGVDLAPARIFSETNTTVLGDVFIESGSVTFPTGVLSVGGSFLNEGSFNASGGEVEFDSLDTGETIDPGSSSFASLDFDSATGGWNIVENATSTGTFSLTNVGDFTLDSGTTFEAVGTFSHSANGASTTWDGLLFLSSGNDYAVNTKTHGGDTFGTVRISGDGDISMWNSSVSALTLLDTASVYSQDHSGNDGDLYIFGDYVRTSGTEYWSYATDFDGTALGGGSRQADVRIANGASVLISTTTLQMQGGATASTTVAAQSGTYSLTVASGTVDARYYEVTGGDADGFSLTASTTITSLRDALFTVATAGFAGMTVDASTIDTNPLLQIFDADFATTTAITASNVALSGSPSSFWWFRNGTANLYGEAYDAGDTDPGSIRWDDSSFTIDVSGTIYSDAGVTEMIAPTCDDATENVRLVINGGYSTTTWCASADGSFSFDDVPYVGDPVLTLYLDTDGGEQGVVVTKTPTVDITDLDLYANRVMTRHEDIVPLSIADMSIYDESDDSDINFVATVGGTDTLTVRPDNSLIVFASTTFTPDGEITLESGGTGNPYDGTFHIDNAATFNASGTESHSVGGRFQVDTGGAFNGASSTVTMTATTTGKNITTPSPQTITFYDLVFNGVGGEWAVDADILVDGDITVTNGTLVGAGDITVDGGTFGGAGSVAMTGGTTLLRGTSVLGSTTPWSFFNLTLGDGVVNGTTTRGGTATTTTLGTLTISAGHALDADDSNWDIRGSGNAFVETGTFLEDTSRVRYSTSSSANILATTYYNLDLSGAAGTPTYTATGVGIVVLNDLTVGGVGATTATFDTNDPALQVGNDVIIKTNGTLVGSDSGAFTVSGSWDNDGTFTSSGGTVIFDTDGTDTIAAGSSSFGNVVATSSGALTITENATATGSFTLDIASFTVDPSVTLAVGNGFYNNTAGGATDFTDSTLTLFGGDFEMNEKTTSDDYDTLRVEAGAAVRMWNSSASTTVVDAAGSLYSMDHADVPGDLYVFGAYEESSATDFWSYARDFDGEVLGAPRQADVYFASGASASYVGTGGLSIVGDASASTTLQNQGSGTYGLLVGGNASTTMNYYTVRDQNASGTVFTGTPNVVSLSNGDIEVAIVGATGMTVGATVIDANPAKNFTGNRFATTTPISAYNVTATGTSVSAWRFANHVGNLSGEAFDNDPAGNPGYLLWEDSAQLITVSGNVYQDEGSSVSTVCDGSTNNIHLRVAGITSYTTSCNGDGLGGGTGAFSIPGVNFNANDTLTLYIEGETENAANVSIDPQSTISNMHLYENRVIVRHEGTEPISIADMAVWDSSDAPGDIPFTAVDAGTDTLTLPADTKLIIWDSKEFEPGGDVTLSGGGAGAAYDGTLELYANADFTGQSGENHSIDGSLVAGNGATFEPNDATVTFTTSGAARTVDSNNGTFGDLTFNGSGSWTVVDNDFDIDGDFAIVAGAVTLPNGTTTVSGSFDNTGGSFDSGNGRVVFDATTGGHTIEAGGSDFNHLGFVGTGGAWSFTDTNATATGALSMTDGTLTLPGGTFTVGAAFNNSAGAVTHNSGTLRLTGTTTDMVLDLNGSNLNSLVINATGDYDMLDANLTLVGDLTIQAGDLALSTSTLTIGGSLDATGGTFESATGSVLFNSADVGETVEPGSSTFYDVVFANASGGWTIAANATATNNFTLTSAANFVVSPGVTIEVNGVFTNNEGGGDTTWTGSTLLLNAGFEYPASLKTALSELYGTLVVDNGTKLRLWNSSTTNISVSATSSVYSQDHAGNNGDLYIFGDYFIEGGTEYWSYATDFDSEPLGGGSRPVDVFIANFPSNSAVTLTNGATLQMVGAVGATTTVQSPSDSDTFAFAATGGTLNAQHYRFDDLDSSGLNLSGTTTLTSLSNGHLELAVDTATLMTLSSTTLTANASKAINNLRFNATSSFSGQNITLVGTTSNFWNFIDSRGSLAGEDYDIDGATDCGSLRWGDSGCQLIEQTHYRWRNDDGGDGAPASEWYDTDWDKRTRVRIENQDNATYGATPVRVNVAYDGEMDVAFEDLRFTENDGTTLVPHFLERYTASTDADIWVLVPSLPANGQTDLFMYYGNGLATSTSSSTPVFNYFDGFEDGDIAEYSGDTGLFTAGGSFAYDGSFGLDTSGFEGTRATDGIYRTDVTVSQGEVIRYWQYVDTVDGSGDEVCTMFGVQAPGSDNNNYGLCLELFLTDRISIVRDVESTDSYGGVTVLASSTLTTTTYSTGWYEVVIDWRTNDTISASLRDANGTEVASTSATDSTYTSGGVGFTYWGQNGGWDGYKSYDRIATDPVVRFGAEQTDGGATWAAALDTAATGFEIGDTARIRFAVENTGLIQTDQVFQLEYAPKGAAPSCEAVSGANYDPVPNQSDCSGNDICMTTSSFVTNGDPTTDRLEETGGDFTPGQLVESPLSTTTPFDIDQDEYTEVEYVITPTINANDPAYCLRVTDEGSELDSYEAVAEMSLQFNPIFSSLSLNGGSNISLVGGTTTTVHATGTVIDQNGYADLSLASTSIFRSGVGETCAPDDNNCYLATSTCSFINCSGNTCELSCSVEMYYFAEPTDMGAYAGETWRAFARVMDASGAVATATAPSIDLFTVYSLSVNETIDYGALAPENNTGSYNASTTLANEGNSDVDILLEGTDLTDGATSEIPVTEQRYATTTFTYSSCTICGTLSTTTSPAFDVDLIKPTSTTPVIDTLYWGINIPFGISAQPHQGQNTFYSTSE